MKRNRGKKTSRSLFFFGERDRAMEGKAGKSPTVHCHFFPYQIRNSRIEIRSEAGEEELEEGEKKGAKKKKNKEVDKRSKQGEEERGEHQKKR